MITGRSMEDGQARRLPVCCDLDVVIGRAQYPTSQRLYIKPNGTGFNREQERGNMFMNDRRISNDLDNYITEHYGEDQFKTAKNISERKRAERNRIRRETNAMLREITGTSARAAREDMGLARS